MAHGRHIPWTTHRRIRAWAVHRRRATPQSWSATTTRGTDGVRVPTFIYGTAWKEDGTTRLTPLALHGGFRGIDTANQRRHYHEAGVGRALAEAGLPRDDVFLQTKFTYRGGQDHRLPY